MDFPKGIEECGTDALRFTLVGYTEQGRNINMDINRVVSNRKFCNKIWNATKYILSQENISLDASGDLISSLSKHYNDLRHVDKWMLHKLATLVQQCNKGMHSFELHIPVNSLYSFLLYDLCDFYLEYTKFLFYKKYNKYSEEQYKVRIFFCLTFIHIS